MKGRAKHENLVVHNTQDEFMNMKYFLHFRHEFLDAKSVKQTSQQLAARE